MSEPEDPAPAKTEATASGGGAVAQGGVAAASGGVAIGRDVFGPVTVNYLGELLAANAGTDLPFERLLRHVWGDRISGDRQALKQLVHRLRQKIEKQPAEPRYLLSAVGVGYRLEMTAARVE